MNDSSSSTIVLSTINKSRMYDSLVWDCADLCRKYGLNLFHILLNVEQQVIEQEYVAIPLELQDTIEECLQFWNIAEKRKALKSIIEKHVPERF